MFHVLHTSFLLLFHAMDWRAVRKNIVEHDIHCLPFLTDVTLGFLLTVSAVCRVWRDGLHSLHSNRSKMESYTHCMLPRGAAGLHMTTFLSISSLCPCAALFLFSVREVVSKIQSLHSKEYDQKGEIKL